jgi:hypothetical protein
MRHGASLYEGRNGWDALPQMSEAVSLSPGWGTMVRWRTEPGRGVVAVVFRSKKEKEGAGTEEERVR